jgi:hypothetical protein
MNIYSNYYRRLLKCNQTDKAQIFSERISAAPKLIGLICFNLAAILARSRFVDNLFKFSSLTRNFVNFLEGNAHLINSSNIEFNVRPITLDAPEGMYDVVVIGSGPGGAIAALRSAKAGLKVLILEEGDAYAPNKIEHHSLEQTNKQFRNFGLNFIWSLRPVLFAEGKTFGGGSEVNSGLYHRLEGIHREKMLSLLQVSKSEWREYESIVEKTLNVSFSADSEAPEYGLVKGARNLGLIAKEVARWRVEGSETPHQSMQVTYLAECISLGVKISTSTKVLKIKPNLENIEICCVSNRGQRKSFSAKQVVVAAGAVGTPKILKASRLISNCVPMNFHPMVRIVGEQDFEINDGDLFPPWQAWTQDLKFKFGYSVSTHPYLKATLSSTGELNSLEHKDFSKHAAYFSSFALEDSKVRIVTIGKITIPLIKWGKKDKTELVSANNLLRKILKSGDARKIYPSKGMAPITTVHIFGSLPIGSSRHVDFLGRLIADTRIRISDSSILPSAPWCNPQGPMMVACEILAKRNLSEFNV